jgi:TolB-like protein/Tfp pilus assembly protein PilF
MAQKTNSFERFWRELKRRKVVHVITIYAATAFVILQLVDMIAEPLRLPISTKALVIVLLCIGFIIAIFLSWIYDITPAGVKKTKPASAVKHIDQSATPTSSGWKIAIYVSAVIIVALVAFNLISKRNLNPDILKLEKSIAVLPFENMSDTEDPIWFGDAMTDEIIMHLYKVKEFIVRSRTSVMQYKGTAKTIPAIGHELKVNYLIEGSAQKIENQVKIRVQLINAVTDNHLWGETFEGSWKDISALQSEIAKQIAYKLKTVLSPEEKEQIEKSQTKSPDAYYIYLQGRFFWNKRTEEGLKKSVEYFEKALAVDPDYALAYAGLADAYFILTWYGWSPKPEGYVRAKEFALRALEINKNLAEAHTTLGSLLYWDEWKWDEAQKELILGIELNPNYAIAHYWYSLYLDIIERRKEAREQINIALELDPFFRNMYLESAKFYYSDGKLEESLDACHKLHELSPEYIDLYWVYFYIYVKQHEDLRAVEALQKVMLNDSSTIQNSEVVKEVYNKSGMNGLFNWLIELQLKNPVPIALAKLYAIIGNKDEALSWLEKAVGKKVSEIPRINSNIDFDILRSEPRFQEIIKKMGLSDYQIVK